MALKRPSSALCMPKLRSLKHYLIQKEEDKQSGTMTTRAAGKRRRKKDYYNEAKPKKWDMDPGTLPSSGGHSWKSIVFLVMCSGICDSKCKSWKGMERKKPCNCGWIHITHKKVDGSFCQSDIPGWCSCVKRNRNVNISDRVALQGKSLNRGICTERNSSLLNIFALMWPSDLSI